MKSIFWIIALALLSSTLIRAQEKTTRILFIGNSYTGQIKKTVSALFKASPEGATTEIEYISPGGKNLEFHLKNEETVKKIKQGNWEFVVLQDQSQTPAIFPDRFKSAALKLDKIIDATGAKTVFYQTWGRRDGDKQNASLFPTYESMQKSLSDSYESVSKRCDGILAPIGDTWAKVRKANPDLGVALYKKDGSHPSDKGAWLAACVFYSSIFQKSPATIDFKGSLSPVEVTTILAALPTVQGMPKKSQFPINRTLTNTNGSKIDVKIGGRSESDVYFISKGKQHVYKINQLSEIDQEFVKNLPVNK